MVLALALATVCLLVFLHPYLTYPASLHLFRARPVRANTALTEPSSALFFSAYNEEKSLPAKLDNIAAIKRLHPQLQVFAYSDCSTDGTVELLRSRSDLLTLIEGKERAGKATGMRRMVALSDAEIAIFTDANVLIDPPSISRLLAYFSDPEVGGVAGSLHYVNADESVTATVGTAYWRLEETIKTLESRSGSIMGADGSLFAVRRAGYPEVPPHLLDDFITSMSVLFCGRRLISAKDVLAFERSATSSQDEFRRKRRIACRAFNSHRYLRPKLKALPPAERYKYVSHKHLRWLGGLFLSAAVVLATLGLAAGGQGWLALLLWVLGLLAIWAGHRWTLPLISAGAGLVSSVFATLLGVCDSLRGRTYQTWAPAQSR